MCKVKIDGETLTVEDVVKVAREKVRVVIADEAKKRVKRAREVLEGLVEKNHPIYGVNTGFGALSTVKIPREESKELQMNLIRSHASGVGKALSKERIFWNTFGNVRNPCGNVKQRSSSRNSREGFCWSKWRPCPPITYDFGSYR